MANVAVQTITALMPEDVISKAVFFFSTKSWRPTSQSQRSVTFEGKPLISKLGRCPNLVVDATAITGGTEVAVQHPKDVAGLVALFLDALPLTAQTIPTRLGTMDERPNADANAAGLTTPQFSPALAVKASPRPLSRVVTAIIVAVIVVGAAGYWWMSRPPERYRPDNGGLYPINVNGRYGFMDRTGKTVIAPQFDQAFGFSEGFAQVRIGGKSGYINTRGVVVISPQFDDALQFQYGRAAVKLCCGKTQYFWQSKPGDQYGFIDTDGKYLTAPNFKWEGAFSGDLAPVLTADGVVGYVNRSGHVVFSGAYQASVQGFASGLAATLSNGKWGFIDTKGKWVIDPQFDLVGSFEDGLAQVRVGGRMGYIDKSGNLVINPQYDVAGPFSEGYAFFSSNGKFGFIDTKGRVAVAPQFLAAQIFSDGLAPVRTGDGWGFIDRSGKIVVSPQFDFAEVFQNGLAKVTALGKEAYVTTAGTFVIDPFPGTSVRAERVRMAAESVSHRR